MAKDKDKIKADGALAYQIATQILMGANNTLIQRLGIPKRVAMRVGAEGLGIMATNPRGADSVEWVISLIRSAASKTRDLYLSNPELTNEDLNTEDLSDAHEDDEESGGDLDSTDILTAAVQEMGAIGMTREDVVPALVDFTATVAIALGGVDAVQACIIRLGDRIKDFHEGTFPVDQTDQ